MKGKFEIKMKTAVFSLIFFTILSSTAFAYTDSEWDPVILGGTFFVVLEQADPLEPRAYDEDAAIESLLREAVFVFSAMIYGFDFEYVPYDSMREVAEEFEIDPVYQIPWGDPGLSVSGGRFEDGVYYADISYRLNEGQLPWYDSWEGVSGDNIKSCGSGSLYSGLDGKLNAVEDTVKQALRDHLRPVHYNKPRRITGRARLSTVPVFSMSAGEYRCCAGITLALSEILEYRIY